MPGKRFLITFTPAFVTCVSLRSSKVRAVRPVSGAASAAVPASPTFT